MTTENTYTAVPSITLGGMLCDITDAVIALNKAHGHITEFLLAAEGADALTADDRARLVAVCNAIENTMHPKVVVVRDHVIAARRVQRERD